jgi:putative PIN family toxin of toxin-antitoxin system
MRIVADTNTVVSGSLWPGKPRMLLDVARAGAIQLITSQPLLNELTRVLTRPKFHERITRAGKTVAALLAAYRDLTEEVMPANIPPTILADPADDAVLAAALGGNAELIVSGDAHLLNLGRFHHLRIVTIGEALALIAALRD